jgi:hypothetical protein
VRDPKHYCVKAAFRHIILKSANAELKKTLEDMYKQDRYEVQQNREYEITKGGNKQKEGGIVSCCRLRHTKGQ